MLQPPFGPVLYHPVGVAVVCPLLVPYAPLHLIGSDSICVGLIGTFLVRYVGIHGVLHQYIIVWIVFQFATYSPSPILCHNIVPLHNTLQVPNTS